MSQELERDFERIGEINVEKALAYKEEDIEGILMEKMNPFPQCLKSKHSFNDLPPQVTHEPCIGPFLIALSPSLTSHNFLYSP